MIVRNRGLGSFIGYQVMAAEELAGYVPHDPAVDFALAAGVFIAGPVTGGSFNPARTLGPMIVAGQFTATWVYVLGPIIRAVLAALLYDRFLSEAEAAGVGRGTEERNGRMCCGGHGRRQVRSEGEDKVGIVGAIMVGRRAR